MSAETLPTLKAFFDAARVRVLGGLLHDAEPTLPLAAEQRRTAARGVRWTGWWGPLGAVEVA